jgi:hypothetical protein
VGTDILSYARRNMKQKAPHFRMERQKKIIPLERDENNESGNTEQNK